MNGRYRSYFVKALRKHLPVNGEIVVDQVDDEYRRLKPQVAFAQYSVNPIDRRLDFTAYFLAAIIVMDRNGRSFDEIRSVCLEIVLGYVQPRSSFQTWLKRLAPKLVGKPWIKPFLLTFGRRVNVHGHPDGFKALLITDTSETYGLGYGIDIQECGICKLFNRNNAAKYASILCEVDEVTSRLAGLELIRSGTIANGAEKCDFRWKRH